MDSTGENAVAAPTFQEKKAVFNDLEDILERIACGIVSFMYSAEWAGSNLDEAIRETMVQYLGGLHELIAVAVFESLMDTIHRLPTKGLLGHAFNTAGKVMTFRRLMGGKLPEKLRRGGGH
ncbi:hypothetical protein MMC22_006700 [Lobaria immixta]|nr:hypothetical protein [Lobaria immixta]